MTTTTTTLRSPLEVDTDLAAAHHVLARALQMMRYLDVSCQNEFGERIRGTYPTRYRNTLAEAWQKVAAAAENGDAYNVVYGRRPSQLLAEREERETAIQTAFEAIETLEEEYRGWSRFYLVTSSSGHIHSSRTCHTCRPSTTYGMRPDLSGKTEAEAVAKLGPGLCSRCFTSAPVAHQAKKLTKAQALRLAA